MCPDRLSITFAALADPTRRAILARVAGGAISVGELAAPFAMSLPAVSKHLKVLEHAGLITRGRDAQRRPCLLKAEPLQEAASWIAEYRQHWELRLDRLDEYLHQLHGHEFDGHQHHRHRPHGREPHAKRPNRRKKPAT